MPPPLVTIGLVVRNGAAHLSSAIESLLRQTFADFELVIYDNASTDATAEIAEWFARRDERVRHVRRLHDIGPLENFIGAAMDAKTPYFCWAAHDDLREPTFLSELVQLLEQNPTAALACCAVRDIDPNGEPRHIRPETQSLQTTIGMTPMERLRLYLHEAPATPIYGLFRTDALHAKLDVLHGALPRVGGWGGSAPMLGLDMVFLASIVADHDLAITHEPLLRFRRGGYSHRIGVYGSLRGFVSQLLWFRREMHRATQPTPNSVVASVRLRWTRLRFFAKYFCSEPIRRMAWHYLCGAMPWLQSLHAHWIVRRHLPFVQLRRRATQLESGRKVVVFGAGKHTRRCWRAIRLAMKEHQIVAICDDENRCDSIAGFGIVTPSEAAALEPDIVVVSSDAYEAALSRRAHQAFYDVPIWCIYDTTLETSAESRSACSTASMNPANSSDTSSNELVEAAV